MKFIRLLLLYLPAVALFAQTDAGSLAGRLTDPSGARVPAVPMTTVTALTAAAARQQQLQFQRAHTSSSQQPASQPAPRSQQSINPANAAPPGRYLPATAAAAAAGAPLPTSTMPERTRGDHVSRVVRCVGCQAAHRLLALQVLVKRGLHRTLRATNHSERVRAAGRVRGNRRRGRGPCQTVHGTRRRVATATITPTTSSAPPFTPTRPCGSMALSRARHVP